MNRLEKDRGYSWRSPSEPRTNKELIADMLFCLLVTAAIIFSLPPTEDTTMSNNDSMMRAEQPSKREPTPEFVCPTHGLLHPSNVVSLPTHTKVPVHLCVLCATDVGLKPLVRQSES